MDTTCLHARQTIQYTAQQGERVVCDTGKLWLTDCGDDIILQDGEQYQMQGDSIVIESLSKDCFFHTESSSAQPGWRQKLHQSLEKLLHGHVTPHATV